MDDLRSFVEHVVGTDPFRVDEVLGDGFVRLNVTEAERRQAKQDIRWVEDVVIELLRNARDANARHVYVATSRDLDIRKICVLDDGDGIPAKLHDRVFEARVTSKLDSFHSDEWGVHGRGMAMYSIRQNVLRSEVAASGAGLGTSIVVDIDCSHLPERADQSSWPRLERTARGRPRILNGPHNIQRTVLEFALAQRDIDVYLGSPLEIAALLYIEDPRAMSLRDLLALRADPESVPVCSRLRMAGDAADLKDACAGIGLDISERSAYRILAGSVDPAKTAFAQARIAQKRKDHRSGVDLSSEQRSIGFTRGDIDRLARNLQKAFEPLADEFYVHVEPPNITVHGDTVTATFVIEHDD